MAGKPRIASSRNDIASFFQKSNRTVFAKADIDRIIDQNRLIWNLPNSITTNGFLQFALNSTSLRMEQIPFEYRPVTRYTWGEAPTFSLVQSINANGYFSHYSAMHLQDLTEQFPTSIYFNQEQQATGGGGGLSQRGIDLSFRGKCRVTTNVAPFRDHRIHLLNGKNTGQLGVVEITTTAGEHLRVTNLERTLIDATVRPVYAGGIFEVAKAFVRAADRLSVNKLVATLKQLNFTYPYHQAIGYYLQRAGAYTSSQLELLRQIPMDWDFYLDYAMKDPAYDSQWRLFVPEGF